MASGGEEVSTCLLWDEEDDDQDDLDDGVICDGCNGAYHREWLEVQGYEFNAGTQPTCHAMGAIAVLTVSH